MYSEKKVRPSIWSYLIGSPDRITAEGRILNAVSVFSFGGIIVSACTNHLLGLHKLANILSLFLLLQAFVYYLSRYARKQLPASILYALGSYAFLGLNFIYNDGITGPTLLAFFLSLQILISITPVKQSWVWVPIHILVVAALTYTEVQFPEIIDHSYPNTLSRALDINSTFLVLIIISYFIRTSTLKRYRDERMKVAQQKKAIEEQNLRLAYIDKERNRLFSIIGHDVRNPVATIQGYLEMLTDVEMTEKEKRDAENELLTLTRHTSEMLDNLLLWSKSQLEAGAVHLAPLNVQTTLHNTLQIQKAIAAKKQITVHAEVPETLSFIADKDRMELVLRNLLSNAIKFTPPGGNIKINARQENGAVSVSVADSGSGIPEAQIEHVFTSEIKPLRGTMNEKGVGLGLFLCKEFMDMQNGRITFQSNPGTGTTFHLFLPAAN